MISKEKFKRNNIDINDIYKIWEIPYILALDNDEIYEGDHDDNFTKFSQEFDLEHDDYDIGNNSLGNEEEYYNEYRQFVQLADGTILMCDFFHSDIILENIGIFNIGTIVIELYDRPNFSVLLVDKMNIYEYNENAGLKLLMNNMNIDWFYSYKLTKLKFKKELFFTYNDDIKLLCYYMLLCTKYTLYKKITKYIMFDILKYAFNNFFMI